MTTWLWILGIGVPLTAASVPLIIHLINLTRYRKVDWAAMEFLLKAYQKTRRKMRLESLIMLMLRVVAVLLFATALFPMGCEQAKSWADNALGTNNTVLSNDAPLHVVIILDNSGSMGYEKERITSFERGRQYATNLVEGLKQNRDRVSLIRMSDVYVPPGIGGISASDEEKVNSRKRRISQLSGMNLEAARRELASTQVTAVDTNMLAAFREASKLVSNTPESDAAALIVVSDFMDSGWNSLRKDGSAHTDFLAVAGRINERLKSSGNTMLFYDAGYEKTSNVGIASVRCTERVIGNGMAAKVLVDLGYYSSTSSQSKSIRLSYRIDTGSERPFGAPVTMRPNQTIDPIQLILTPKELALKPDELKTGASRNIQISITDPDGLKLDNTRNLVIHVVPNVPILVVNGSPAKDPRLDETFNLEVALGMSDNKVDDERSSGPIVRITPNRIMRIKSTQLASEIDFLEYRLIILCNVASVTDTVIKKLEDFVKAGFGLIIFDGKKVDAGKYNSDLYKKGKGLLPVKLGAPGGTNDADMEGESLTIPASARSHKVLELFTAEDDLEAIISDPDVIRNWRNVTLPSNKEADPLRPSRVLLNVDSSDGPKPFMVERSYGQGNVMYIATTASEQWNTMWNSPMPLFLYLEVASYMTGSEVRYSNLGVGEPYRRILRITDKAAKYSVRDPGDVDAEVVTTAEDGISLLEFAGTSQPGVYSITANELNDDGSLRRKWQERFAVNLESRESNMRRLKGGSEATATPEGVLKEALGEEIKILFQSASDELEDGESVTADDSGGLWMWLAILGAGFLLMETFWSAVVSKSEE